MFSFHYVMWNHCINLHPMFMTPLLQIKKKTKQSCDLNIVTRTMMWMLFKAIFFYIYNLSTLNCLLLTPFHECGYSLLHTSHCLTAMLWTKSRVLSSDTLETGLSRFAWDNEDICFSLGARITVTGSERNRIHTPLLGVKFLETCAVPHIL